MTRYGEKWYLVVRIVLLLACPAILIVISSCYYNSTRVRIDGVKTIYTRNEKVKISVTNISRDSIRVACMGETNIDGEWRLFTQNIESKMVTNDVQVRYITLRPKQSVIVNWNVNTLYRFPGKREKKYRTCVHLWEANNPSMIEADDKVCSEPFLFR